jgi:hypothetical protein
MAANAAVEPAGCAGRTKTGSPVAICRRWQSGLRSGGVHLPADEKTRI